MKFIFILFDIFANLSHRENSTFSNPDSKAIFFASKVSFLAPATKKILIFVTYNFANTQSVDFVILFFVCHQQILVI